MPLLFIILFACFSETDTKQMKYKYIQNQNNSKQNTENIWMADIVPSSPSLQFQKLPLREGRRNE